MVGLKFTGNKKSKLYSAQANNMAYANQNAVLSGCEVTAGTGMTVDVASGKVFFGVDEIEISATSGLTISAPTSDSKVDLIVTDNTGTVSVITGTSGAEPMTPDYDPDTYIPLAMVTTTSTTSSITSDEITDIRVLNIGGGGSGGGTFGRHIEEFTSQTSVTVTHNLGDDEPNVFVYNSSSELIEPNTVTVIDTNSLTVTFGTSTTGKIIVYGGAGMNNGYYSTTFTASTTWTVNHYLNNKYVSVKCYDSSDNEITPSNITLNSDSQLTITWGSATAGTVVVTGGVSSYGLPTTGTEGEVLTKTSTGTEWRGINEKLNSSEILRISVTDTSASTSLSSLTNTHTITLINEGANTLYFEFDSTATTDGFPLFAGQSVTFEDVDFSDFSAICASGETSTLKILCMIGSNAGRKTNFEILKISASTTSASNSFTDTTTYKDIIIVNEELTDTFVELDSVASTTGGIKLQSEDKLVLNNSLYTNFSAVTSSGTSTIKILGVY